MGRNNPLTCQWCGRYLMIGDEGGSCATHSKNEMNPDWMRFYGKKQTDNSQR